MEPDPAGLSRERAAASEPCSTRPNPFDDNNGPPSRKRQRTSHKSSRACSVETTTAMDTTPDSMPSVLESPSPELASAPPRSPSSVRSRSPPEPTSSKVTLNLRTAPPAGSIPSSSSPLSPTPHSKMAADGLESRARQSIESGSDGLSTIPAVESPSSSSLAPQSPEVEVVAIDEDGGVFVNRSPPLAIIDEDELFADPILSFPFNGDGETLVGTVKRLVHFMQYEPVEDDTCFRKLRDWMESYLTFTHDHADTWYESYSKFRSFWNAFPEVVWALSWRSRFFADFLDRSREGHSSLGGFFCQFSRLAGRFAALDAMTLTSQTNGSDDYPDLASRPYLQAFSYLLRLEEPGHIGRNLETHYNWSWEEEAPLWLANFQDSGGSLANLTKVAEEQLKLVPRFPRLVDGLSEPCRLIAILVNDAAKAGENDRHRRQPTESPRQRLVRGYDFFNVMSAGLVSIIEKYITFLSPDAAQTIFNGLASTLYASLNNDNSTTRELIATKLVERPEMPTRFAPKTISVEWKFTILKMLITSAQMQLRVIGVTAMCTDLLALHSMHKGDDGSQPSILLYFAEFVIRNKIMEYLVGIASHPEIINESSNILGFLIVTNTYKPDLVSTIWQTVSTSQDPRVVEAILRMLQRCFHLQRYEDLVYLCKKAGSLRIGAFTVAMRDFCDELLRVLMDKASHEGIRQIDGPPYEMCIRLLRESSRATAESPAGYTDIQIFAAARLCDLASRGPTDEIREAIYTECVSDVSSKSATAPGSICVINGFLQQRMEPDLRKLTTEHRLTSLVIQELESTVAEDRFTPNQSVQNSPVSSARSDLILSIILKEPDTLTIELSTRLWNLLVGPKSKTVDARNTSWHMLTNAVRNSSIKNAFIAICLEHLLPTLPADCFTIGALDFTRLALSAWLAEVHEHFAHEEPKFVSHALDQLWRMVLIGPANTIESQAIQILVEVYVGSPLILSLPRSKARSVHLALVDRCLGQLASAAAKLQSLDQQSTFSNDDTAMAVVASDAEVEEQELIFARSLAVLRDFLRTYSLKPHFATPKARASLSIAPSAVEGEPFTVKYQTFDGEKHTDVLSITLGKLNTVASLVTSLQKATGFKSFKLFYGGKVFDPDDIQVSKSLGDLNLNGLVLVQKRDEDDIPGLALGTKTSLELEIFKRMDELWGYLGMRDKVAQEIYSFLVKFPAYNILMAKFDDETISYKEVFPPGQSFKSLYAVYALREYIRAQIQNGAINEGALTRATKLVVSSLSDPDLLNRCPEGELRDSLALHLIDSLVMFLKEPTLPTSVEVLLDDTLLQRLLELLNRAKLETSQHAAHLTWRSIEAIMESCVYNPALWSSFKSYLASNSLLGELLLKDPRPSIRKSIAKQILAKCTFNPTLARVSSTEFSVAFWPFVVDLIQQANQHPLRCEELFSLALALFKRLAETSLEFINLEGVMRQWTSLLYGKNSKDNGDHPENFDTVTQGLANLCYTATSFAKASEQTLACSDMGVKLFRKHLFPELAADDTVSSDVALVPNFPCLNPTTRHVISETIFHLVKDNEQEYRDVLLHLSSLVPYEISEIGPYVYDLPFLFERNRSCRSPTGYAGLRNLSNTCYLNSLFTQLFMNTPFREFMLNATVADPGGSQKLLAETQNLFSYMQNSLRRFVDPTNLAASIRTYDEGHIDVSIQMDVDEFYNLLFDRWEGQILAAESKKQFRSFFGGQLVQQVKSKECPHISERLEPFSAIQCDIKGKSCLQDSLQAYVDGEILAGDNKYKCSTCDRHVDAVKRACLKSIPDNLIFHLKRFDFNLRTLQRSKINDYFSFPDKIDMRPYKVEHLMDSPEECPEDIFELVGILVHSGTAESGHYYSYIRERPSTSGKENWVEFNDDNVSSWEPRFMEGSCFGGVDYRGPTENGNVQYDKNYSAYMLFYQRSSYLAAQKQELEKSAMSSPVSLPLPPRLSNHIAMENELLLRKYCLYDPSHATFVGKMLSNIKHINNGSCSESHSLEKLGLVVALNHLDQVIARTKDLPDFPNFILGLRQMCNNCAECSRDFLEWFSDRPECLRHLLLRNPDTLVRTEMAASILAALIKVKADAPYAYGLGEDEDSTGDLDAYEDPRLLQRVVRTTVKLWDMFHNNCRAWPEYFGLLLSIASLGEHEAAILLDAGYLRRTLEVISADTLLPLSNQYQRMLNIISKRVTTRPVSYDSVIGLLYKLLRTCDLSMQPIEDVEERLESSLHGGAVPLTLSESRLLTQHWTRGQAHILTEKLLQIHQNYHATRNIIILLLDLPDNLDHQIFQAIVHGIRRGTASMPSGPSLRAAITYCQHSEDPDAVPNMVTQVSKIAAHIDNLEGKEFLQFYKDLVELTENKSNILKEILLQICLENISDWAPPLLNYYDVNVREDMEKFLNEHILGYGPHVKFGTTPEDVERANMIILLARRVGIGCLEFLNDTYVKERQQAVRACLENILNVIAVCATFFDDDAEDDATIRFIELRSIVIPALTKITVEELDEELSEWENSEGDYGSEPMESIGELCVGISDELDGAL